MVSRTPLAPTPLIPEEFADQYRQAGLWIDQTIPEFLLAQCRTYAQNLALVAQSHSQMDEGGSPQEIRWTYADLEAAGWSARQRIIAAGVTAGDRVLLQLPNIAEYMAYLLGVFWAGALPVFCLPAHREKEISHFARKTDAAAHIFSTKTLGANHLAVHEALVDTLQAEGLVAPVAIDVAQPPVDSTPREEATLEPVYNTDREKKSEQVAFLQLSGGTTGISKLIPRTHAAYLYSVRESAKICELTQDSTLLVVLPAAHNFTMSSAGILGAMQVGSAMVFAADPSPQTSFRLIEQEKVKVASLVPPLAQAWIASAEKRRPAIESLELLQVGGAKLLKSVAEKVEPVLGARLQQVFGMAEGLVNYTRSGDSDQMRYLTQGRPISELDEILVVDDNDQPVTAGESGHLLTRGPYTIRGYYLEPGINQKNFTEDGFYRSGDIVKIHPTGDIEVTGRAKDQINRNGEKIAVDEIEDLVLAREDVHDAVVLGIPDETVGERVCLVLVPVPGADFGQNPRLTLQAFFKEAGLADFKIPERVEVLSSLPTTNVGKISRKDVRALLLEQLTTEGK